MELYQNQTPLIPKEHINIDNLMVGYDVFLEIQVCEYNDQTEGDSSLALSCQTGPV